MHYIEFFKLIFFNWIKLFIIISIFLENTFYVWNKIFAFLVLVLLVIFISIQIIGNTTNLSLSNRKDFIEILRYNGASNLFIKTPFFIETFLQSLIGSLLAFFLVKYGFVVINSYLGVNIEIDHYLWAWMIVLSLIISIYASGRSMKRILVWAKK